MEAEREKGKREREKGKREDGGRERQGERGGKEGKSSLYFYFY